MATSSTFVLLLLLLLFCFVSFCFVFDNVVVEKTITRAFCVCFCLTVYFAHRWRIQKAFYTPASVGSYGCAGISWRDLFLRCPTCRPKMQRINLSQALTLEDLDDVKPIYISGITINKWRRTTSPKEPDYELLTMSPNGIERLDRPPHEREFDGMLMPMDVHLSDAMATSAAAVDHHMGAREGDDASFRDLKVMLGVSMGTTIVADVRHEGKRNCFVQVRNTSFA